MSKRKPAADLDPPEIAAYEHALVQVQEEHWEMHAVPEPKRARLRPGVVALAKAVADGLRADYRARTTQP